MKTLTRYFFYIVVLALIFFVNLLFFTHKPPEVQLAFISPGLFILGYSVFRDRLYVKSRMRLIRGR
jgi:hypothetical protein